MGSVWYRGLYYKRDRGDFPDYYSCSHIRIHGGVRLGGSYELFFEAGDNRTIVDGKCQTSAAEIGPCEHNGCPSTRSFIAIPKVFQNGGSPAAITPATVASGLDNPPDMSCTPSAGSSPDMGSRPDDQPLSMPSDDMSITEASDNEPAQVPVENNEGNQRQGPGREAGGRGESDAGVCKGIICCASSRGKCGGGRCHLQPGGGPSCCMGPISESGKSCSHRRPLCIRD